MGTKEKFTYAPLEWDTDYFGVSCSKLTLHKELLPEELKALIVRNNEVKFLTIVNENSDPKNSKIIGEWTNAFLADINIQFQKKISYQYVECDVTISNNFSFSSKIIELASFQVSRFVEDQKLSELGGTEVYKEWLKNAFNRTDKYFATSVNCKGEVDGFILFSFTSDKCVIELIAVDVRSGTKGLGTKLFKSVESYAYEQDIETLQVGTQIRNQTAINFYHKMGCNQVGCHQIYHYWLH